MRTIRNSNLGLLILVILFAPSMVWAEAVDYGSLQSLFGEPVTTSATGTPQRASDVPANMTIITADEIRQSGSRSIPEILSRVPGLDILQTGENSFDVGVRGFQQAFQPRLLVLVDGRQVFLDDYSRTIWSNIPVNIDDIRQIEVVKGASSALFGSNAAGGVVNILTYSPVYDKNNVANATFGTQQSATGDATVTAKLAEQSGIKVSAGGMSANEFRTDPRPADFQIYSPGQRYAVESSVFQVTQTIQANTELTYSESWANPGQVAFETDSEAATSYSIRGGLSWQSPLGLITNNNYVNHTSAHAVGNGFTSDSTTQLIVSQLQDQFKIGADDFFRAAIEYRNKTYTGTDAGQVFPQAPYFDQNVYSASGSWLRQFNDKLSWTNAVRIDHQDSAQTGTLFTDAFETNADYSHVINALSANSGLVYKATNLDSFRATYGRGVQIPGLIQEGLTDTIPVAANTYYDVEGNPKLKPTIVTDYELGYDRGVPTIFSTAKFSVYYETNQDIAGFDAGSFTRTVGGNTYIVLQSVNVGNSQGLGGEFELKGSHDGFRWDGSYSYARDIDTTGVENFVGYDGSAPRHHVRLSGGYTMDAWEFDTNAQYLSSTHMLRASGLAGFAPVYTDGYASLGGRIGYNINNNIRIALSGTNITRSTTQESPFPAIERQVFLSLTGHL
jgi:outer membrane receptor for ferrienterochelin and colicins